MKKKMSLINLSKDLVKNNELKEVTAGAKVDNFAGGQAVDVICQAYCRCRCDHLFAYNVVETTGQWASWVNGNMPA